MPLKERIDLLRLKTGQVISEDWFDELGDLLEDITSRGAVSYEGYVYRSLVPYKTRTINLGSPAFEFLDGHFVNVYTENVYVGDYGRIPSVDADEVVADEGKFDRVVVSEYVQSKDVKATNKVETNYLNVFEKVTTKDLDVDRSAEFDEIVSRIVYVNERLYSYGGSYLGSYASACKGDFHELFVDFLHVTSEVDVPDYSIGFVKLDPKIVSTPIVNVTIPPNDVVIVPRGVYYVSLPSGVVVEANFNGDWREVSTNGGLVVSDGANVRFNNTTASEQTVEMLLIR